MSPADARDLATSLGGGGYPGRICTVERKIQCIHIDVTNEAGSLETGYRGRLECRAAAEYEGYRLAAIRRRAARSRSEGIRVSQT